MQGRTWSSIQINCLERSRGAVELSAVIMLRYVCACGMEEYVQLEEFMCVCVSVCVRACIFQRN